MGLNDVANYEDPVIVIGGRPVGVGVTLELSMHGQRLGTCEMLCCRSRMYEEVEVGSTLSSEA